MKTKATPLVVLAITATLCTSCAQAEGADSAVPSASRRTTNSSEMQALPSQEHDAALTPSASSTVSEQPTPSLPSTSDSSAENANSDPYFPPAAVIPPSTQGDHGNTPAPSPAPRATDSSAATAEPTLLPQAPEPRQPIPVLPTNPDAQDTPPTDGDVPSAGDVPTDGDVPTAGDAPIDGNAPGEDDKWHATSGSVDVWDKRPETPLPQTAPGNSNQNDPTDAVGEADSTKPSQPAAPTAPAPGTAPESEPAPDTTPAPDAASDSSESEAEGMSLPESIASWWDSLTLLSY